MSMNMNVNMRKVLVLGCAAVLSLAATEVRAAYSIGVSTSPSQNVNQGSSGQSYFDVTFSGSGTFTYVNKNFYAVDSVNNPLTQGVDSPFSSLTTDAASTLKLGSGNTYVAGTYRLIVDWTVAGAANPDQYGVYFNLIANDPGHSRINGGATDSVTVHAVSVPEASQVAASALLLIGGVVVYAGRRSVRNKVAQPVA